MCCGRVGHGMELYIQRLGSSRCWKQAHLRIAQALRPSGAVIDYSSDAMAKLAKKVEKDYEGANADARKYFALLAVGIDHGILRHAMPCEGDS
jgi:hypothetical protein